jgi:hypothetical protein
MLPQILTATILDVAFGIIRDLDDIRALSVALGRDLAARARSEGRAVDLMHAHAHAIVLTYAHALDLTRAAAITTTAAAAPDLIAALHLARPRALADALAGNLTGALEFARVRAVELTAAIDQDLSILGAFDFDVEHSRELARVHAADLDRADVIARTIAHDPDPELARVLGLSQVDALGPALPLPGILGLPLRWIADGPLASTLLQVLAAHSPAAASPAHPAPGDPYQVFAVALASRAGILATTRLRAELGPPLTNGLRTLTAAESARDVRGSNWSRVTGLSHLTDACAPISSTHQIPSPAQAAALRAVALALVTAGDTGTAGKAAASGGLDADGVLRAVAATVTLVESRGKGQSPVGESIILAVE